MSAMASPDTRRVVVIGGPPTSNGDLHIGHLAGPYIGADVHVRYLRSVGRDTVFASCTDDSQTYVATSAARVGLTPEDLVEQATGQIKNTLTAMGVGMDGFSPTDDGYRAMVYDYVHRLYDLGRFRLRTVRLPYSERTGKFLVEGLVGGECPTCLADSRGGSCESCGHPIDFDELIDPYSNLDPDDELVYRDAEILVLPMEEYRDRLTAYHEAKAVTWRPHVVALMRELLAKPLPDFAITFPVDRGLPARFPETPGQTLNAWLEGIPASMYCTAYAQRRLGQAPPTDDSAWRAENDARTVVFMGFDPLWVWGMVHVAELIAHEDRYVLPDTLLVNEFYELENDKFSTSKGHVVWARDLVADVPRDIVRFYLTLTAPEHSRTTFSRAALDDVAGRRLVGPWQELSVLLAKLTAEAGADSGPLPVSPAVPGRVAAMIARFAACFELDSFSLSRAADLVVQNVDRLRGHARRALAADLDPDALLVQLGDLFLQLRALIACASPILIDLAARSGIELTMSPDAFVVTHTTAFAVPNLDPRNPPSATDKSTTNTV